MNIYHLVLAGALSLAILSCTKESGTPLALNPETTETKDLSYLRLSLSRPNDVVLRSLTTDDPMVKVEHLTLLFYETEGNSLESIKDVTISSPSQLSNIIVKLPPKDYKLVALANATETIKSLLTIGSPLSVLTEGQALNTRDLYHIEKNLILMSNSQGAVSVTRDKFMRSSASESSKTVHLSLEPILARVLVYGRPNIRMGKKGQQTPKYLINNLLKKTSLLRQLNKLSTGVEEQALDGSNREQRYAKSYIWDSWMSQVGFDEIAQREDRFFAADRLDAEVKEQEGDISIGHLQSPYIYAKENALPSEAFVKGLVPYVMLAYPYVPNGLDLDVNEGWLSYRGKYYRERDVKQILSQSVSSEHSELKQTLLSNGINTSSFDKGFDKGGLKFYHKAYSYYAIFIKHFGEATTDNYGKYGIVRGNEYHITLREIGAAGSPIPIKYDNSSDPIVEQEHSSLAVDVITRTRRTQIEDL